MLSENILSDLLCEKALDMECLTRYTAFPCPPRLNFTLTYVILMIFGSQTTGVLLQNTLTDDEETSGTDSSDTETESDHYAASSSLIQSPSF